METILKDAEKHGSITVLSSDNGGEFIAAPFRSLLERHNIKQIFSQSYTPQSQGMIERFNGTMKSLIYGYLTQYETKRYIDVLPDLVKNYNEKRHSTIRQVPRDVLAGSVSRAPVEERIRHNASKSLNVIKTSLPTIQVGDKVRVAIVKDIIGEKGYKVRWSRDVYTVETVMHPRIAKTDPKTGIDASKLATRFKLKEIPGTIFLRHKLQKIDTVGMIRTGLLLQDRAAVLEKNEPKKPAPITTRSGKVLEPIEKRVTRSSKTK